MAQNYTTTAQSLTQDRRRHIRREMDLDRDELFFLLESYRNMIELNTTLLERQEVINKGIEKALTDTAKISSNQAVIVADIGKLPETIGKHITAMIAIQEDNLKEVKTALQNNRKAENNEHHAHTLRIYGAYGVLTTIILALIGLIAKLWRAP